VRTLALVALTVDATVYITLTTVVTFIVQYVVGATETSWRSGECLDWMSGKTYLQDYCHRFAASRHVCSDCPHIPRTDIQVRLIDQLWQSVQTIECEPDSKA